MSADNTPPTYVFPQELRAEVRRRFPTPEAGARDEDFEGREGAYRVTWDDMQAAKWPRPPEACAACRQTILMPNAE